MGCLEPRPVALFLALLWLVGDVSSLFYSFLPAGRDGKFSSVLQVDRDCNLKYVKYWFLCFLPCLLNMPPRIGAVLVLQVLGRGEGANLRPHQNLQTIYLKVTTHRLIAMVVVMQRFFNMH